MYMLGMCQPLVEVHHDGLTLEAEGDPELIEL